MIDSRGPSAQAFYGGWSYAELIHTPCPGALADISGAYPWAYVDKDLVRFDVAKKMLQVSALSDVRRLFADGDLRDRLLSGEVPFATQPVLVELRPRGEAILPVRATWDNAGRFSMTRADFEGASVWCWLDDLLAGVALDGQFPVDVVRAIELVPVGEREGLQPVCLITGRVVDPASEDLVNVVSVERRRVTRDDWREPATRERMAHHLRMLGTTLAFGNRARVDRVRLRKRETSAVLFAEEVLTLVGRVREVPGPHLDLVVAGSVTARVRLAMAVAIAGIEHLGGTVLHVATDSILMAVNHAALLDSDEDPTHIRGLAISQIDSILNKSKAPWAWKDGDDRELIAVVSGTYKWALIDPKTGEVHCTESMLGGVYLDPSGTGARTADGKHAWAVVAHGAVAKATLEWSRTGVLPILELPDWADLPAVRPGEARTPTQLERLQAAFPERTLRPFTKFALALVDPLGGSTALPVTLDVDLLPNRWDSVRWRDLRTGEAVKLHTGSHYFTESIRCRSMREVVAAWRIPNDQSRASLVESDHVLAPGIYKARPVTSFLALFEAIGKQGDELLNLMVDPLAGSDEELALYRRADTWVPIADLMQRFDAKELKRLTGIPERTLRRILAGGRPSSEHAEVIAQALRGVSDVPERTCTRAGCGKRVRRRQTYCGDACRKASARASERLDLNERGARRCRQCGSLRIGDATTPCPNCTTTGTAPVVAVCHGCGATRLGASGGPCPACGETP